MAVRPARRMPRLTTLPCSKHRPPADPDLLKVLAEMGHDDAIVLADANFTAMSLGRRQTRAAPARHWHGARCAGRGQRAAPGARCAAPVAYMRVGGTEVPLPLGPAARKPLEVLASARA